MNKSNCHLKLKEKQQFTISQKRETTNQGMLKTETNTTREH